jgi:hypothetical protein
MWLRQSIICSSVWLHLGICLLLAGTLSGCGTLDLSPPPSSPFFVPDSADKTRLDTLTRDLDTLAVRCTERNTCEQVHYARALVALFESREAARTSFRRVISAAPTSELAASSTRWLQLLQARGIRWFDDEEQQAITEITAQLLREWLDRKGLELITGTVQPEIHLSEKTGSLASKREMNAGESGMVQTLQRRVSDRDRRIAELTSQLEALKRIDQDISHKFKPVRPLAGVVAP